MPDEITFVSFIQVLGFLTLFFNPFPFVNSEIVSYAKGSASFDRVSAYVDSA